jgi:predicted metal-dependent peptidase
MKRINVYVDTSGSFSMKEINEAYAVIHKLHEQNGKKFKYVIFYWHTEVYLKFIYNPNEPLPFPSGGGTNPECVIDHIAKSHPHKSYIITDGYYNIVKRFAEGEDITWVIADYGNYNHDCRHIGQTIYSRSILFERR